MSLSISQKLYLLTVPTLLMGVVVGTLSWQSLRRSTGELKLANELSQQAILSRLYVAEMSDALKGFILNPSNTAEADRKKKADDMNAETINKMKTLTTDPKFLASITELGKYDDDNLNPAEDKVLALIKKGKMVLSTENCGPYYCY